MNPELYSELLHNVTFLTTLIIIYEISYTATNQRLRLVPVLNGVLIGLIGVVIIALSFPYCPGIFMDTRSILISITALFFGTVSTIVAALIMIIYRLILDGSGLSAGILSILTSAGIGLLWRHFMKPRRKPLRFLNLYLFGAVVSLFMLLDLFVMPVSKAVPIFQETWIPIMVLYPPATVLISIVLLHLEDKKESQRQLAEAEERYKSLFNNNHGVMLLIDPKEGDIIDANPAAEAFYGWDIHTLKTMKITEINLLEPDQTYAEMLKSVRGKEGHFFFRHRKASGDPIHVEVYSGPVKLNGKTLIYSVVHDISERAASEMALAESEKRFRLLVESAPEAIYIETEGIFTYLNQFAVALFGAESAEQLLGTPVLDRVPPEDQDTVRKRMEILRVMRHAVPVREEIFLTLAGTPIQVEVNASPIHYENKHGALVFARDITEKKLLEKEKIEIEAQLRQQQKLEAIGTLAGGVAHEINNPINGIMNYAQLILDISGPKDEKQQEFAREIIFETQRVATIVRNLLQFSRQEKQSHSYASIYDIIHQSVSLIQTIVKRDQILLTVDLDEDLPDIKCRSQQIQQVIMNLLTNARDALNEKYHGYHENKVIRIRCSQSVREDRRWLRIIIEDHGNGVPATLRDKIFEPFFSTKPKEIGTGLGLSISFGIVSDHHGTISIESEEGSYSRFILDLPVDNGWQLEG